MAAATSGVMGSPGGRSSPSSRLLRDQIRTVKRVDLAGHQRVEIVPIESDLSFDKGLFMFIRAVQQLRQSYDVRTRLPVSGGRCVVPSMIIGQPSKSPLNYARTTSERVHEYHSIRTPISWQIERSVPAAYAFRYRTPAILPAANPPSVSLKYSPRHCRARADSRSEHSFGASLQTLFRVFRWVFRREAKHRLRLREALHSARKGRPLTQSALSEKLPAWWTVSAKGTVP
jgi:hypothetical protein